MKIESPYEFGERIKVWNNNVKDQHRIFIKVGKEGGVLTVKNTDEEVYGRGEDFESIWWPYHESIQPKKTRTMTAKELLGMYIKFKNGDLLQVQGVLGNGHICIGHCSYVDINQEWQYTSTPSDDSSWKSVKVECE